MLTRSTMRGGNQRRGVILMVVLSMLTLFIILGLAFVLYSDAEATSARIYRESQTYTRAGSDSDRSSSDASAAWNMFLGQLIYDLDDSPNSPGVSSNVLSGLRGHSLARTMYGWNDGANSLNDKPYCGTGRLNETISFPTGPSVGGQRAVNYTYFPSDGGLRDPGRGGPNPSNNSWVGYRTDPTQARCNLVGDVNVPYTYPDHNNLFLAMLDPTTGQVLTPSYYRYWLMNGAGQVALSNKGSAYYTQPTGKYYLLRPRPQEVDPTGTNGFPYPSDPKGDVKNLDWAPGGMDSIWIDINAPVVTLPDGTKYKMLVAPLVLDMDGRVNLNVAGNLLSWTTNAGLKSYIHGSNQGWGPWEVNLSTVLNLNTASTEWTNVLLGNDQTIGTRGNSSPTTSSLALGRYGFSGTPQQGVFSIGGTPVRIYFPMDYNAIHDSGQKGFPALSSQWQNPSTVAGANAQPFQNFPYFDPTSYGNAVPNETTAPNPTPPAYYNPLRPVNGNNAFTYNDLASLLRTMNIGGENASSRVLDLVPNNLRGTMYSPFDLQAFTRRGRVTTHSFDLDRAGVVPYIYDLGVNAERYKFTGTGTVNGNAVANGNVPGNYPQVGTGIQLSAPRLSARNTATLTNSEFDPTTWQSIYGAIMRVDLGRKLTNYPGLGKNNQFDPTNAQFQQAVQDRQKLAQDIFNAMCNYDGTGNNSGVMGSVPISQLGTTYKAGSPEYQAVRYLAQLAVNIVDFVDYDDYITPFNWLPSNTAEFVFGTEMPRVVINEYYSQWDNDYNDLLKTVPAPPYKANSIYRVNNWVELYAPFPPDPNTNLTTWDNQGTVLLFNGPNQGNNGNGNGYAIYRVRLCPGPNVSIRNATNTRGSPDNFVANGYPSGATNVNAWGATATTQQIVTGWNGTKPPYYNPPSPPANSAQGFYVLGPSVPGNPGGNPYPPLVKGGGFGLGSSNPHLPVTHRVPGMSYTLPFPTVDKNGNNLYDPTAVPNKAGGPDYRPSVLLQRLANPYLPPQPTYNAATPWTYNPYITVDYVSQVVTGDCRRYNPLPVLPTPTPVSLGLKSYGRRQPYAAAVPLAGAKAVGSQWMAQAPKPPQPANQPGNTFFGQNAVEVFANAPPPSAATGGQTLQIPFDVQYHPDRPLASIADLLSVSGFKPHEFTQQFVDVNGTKFAHRAPWSDQTSRLIRLWDFLTIGGRMSGFAAGGRIPGKININAIWDQTVFQALCDSQTTATNQGANLFSQTDVNNIWTSLLANRSQDTDNTTGSNMPGPNSVPFWSLGMGYTTNYDMITANFTAPTTAPQQIYRDINYSFLRPRVLGTNQPPVSPAVPPATMPPNQPDLGAGQLRLLEPSGATLPGAESNARFELMSKILGNVTTRSNVYGVWLTVGFFQVVKDAAPPPNAAPAQLGPEYVWPSSQGPIRHKYFAIIDRSQLQVWPTYDPQTAVALFRSNTAITVPDNTKTPPTTWSTPPSITFQDKSGNATTTVTNPYNQRTWTLQAGAVLTYEPNTDNEETVVVYNNGAGGFQATFWKNHAKGVAVISRGNPGPWPLYDPKNNPNVIPYDPTIDPYVVPFTAKIN
jgi:hypothetical protein